MTYEAEGRAPICPNCGVTVLADDTRWGETVFICENPDCDVYGEAVE